MATPDLTSGTVMDQVAALLNDQPKSIYTYPIQLPYLNMALQELQETFELNEVPVTETVSAIITVPAGTSSVAFGLSAPALPEDLIEPQILWESLSGEDQYVPMTKKKVLPRYMEGIEISQFQFYTWQHNEIRFFAANIDIDIKMDYIRSLFTPFTQTDGSDEVSVINAATFLEYKTASLCARFIGENPTRADSLAGEAVLGIDRALGISSKGRQSLVTRRRPFRSAFKQRSYI